MSSASPQAADSRSLFPLGFHNLTVGQVEQVCVDLFPLSVSRPVIFAGLQTLFARLERAGVPGEVWADGSFLTEKIDPDDIDVVLRVDAAVYNTGTSEQVKAIDWVLDNQKLFLKCDSYAFFEYPEGHHLYYEGQWWYSYWHRQWGFGREGDLKGIVVLSLGTGDSQ